MTTNSPALPRTRRLLERILRWPRLARIAFVALVALAVTVLLVPRVDEVYMLYYFDWNTRIAPALVSCGVGLVVYALGWWLLVGMVGEAPRPRRAALWYVIIGIVALIVVVLLLLIGAVIGSQN